MQLHEQAASMLLDVRKTGKLLTNLPEHMHPSTLDEAYIIQDASVRAQGAVGGWKLSMSEKKEGRFVSAIPAPLVIASPATLPAPKGVVVEIEGEIALRVARDLLPRDKPYTAEEVADAIGSLHAAIEVLGSRFANRKAVPPLVAVADLQSNAGIVYGPGLTDWRKVEFADVKMTLTFDGAPAAKADGGPATATAMTALAFLADQAVGRHGGLKQGQIIITGARVKPIVLNPGVTAELDVVGIGKASLRLA